MDLQLANLLKNQLAVRQLTGIGVGNDGWQEAYGWGQSALIAQDLCKVLPGSIFLYGRWCRGRVMLQVKSIKRERRMLHACAAGLYSSLAGGMLVAWKNRCLTGSCATIVRRNGSN